MDAELTGIARRFAACPKWVWLPGMAACRMDGDVCVNDARIDAMGEDVGHPGMALNGTETECAARFPLHCRIPGLDDETTCAAIMPVVRRAWNDPHAFVRFFDRTPLEGHWFWECGVGSRRQCGFVADVKHGELLALLAALEAAK